MRKFSRRRSIVAAIALSAAVAACGSESLPEQGGEDQEFVDPRALELERRLATEGRTPELVALVRSYNAEAFAKIGLIFTIALGDDHEVAIFETSPGVISYAERVGGADTGTGSHDAVDLSLPPADLFRRLKPGENVPDVLIDAEARMTQSATAAASAIASVDDGSAQAREDTGAPAPQGGIRPQHSTSNGSHFRDDVHSYTDGFSSKACQDANVTTTHRVCWPNRTSGGFSEFKSTHADWFFGLYVGNTTFSIFEHGQLVSQTLVLQGELWHFTGSVTWHCPGIFGAYCGNQGKQRKASWNGSGKNWHFAAHYRDVLRV